MPAPGRDQAGRTGRRTRESELSSGPSHLRIESSYRRRRRGGRATRERVPVRCGRSV